LSFEETKRKIVEGFMEDLDEEDLEEYKEDIEKMRRAKDFDEIVDAFIRATWDLPSFEWFVDGLDIPREHKITLLGIAKIREDDWDT
jgi:hypothetical protein